jgi:PKD repeat protein
MVRISRILIAVVAAGLLVSACTVKKTERPQLTGPSELALSLALSASPDILTQDGSSQSHVVILARDQNGLAVKGLPLHVEHSESMCCAVDQNGILVLDANKQPIRIAAPPGGQLSSQDVSTGNDGRATLSYTAPTATDSVDRDTIVAILVTPTGTDYGTSQTRSVNIRLVPPGFVPAGPVAAYTYSPTMPVPNSPVTFDGSASVSDTAIIGYSWSFGDGATGTGVSPQHTYRSAGSYLVALTIIDDKGRVSNPCEGTIVVASTTPPVANFVFSPSTPAPSQTIFFNASTSVAGTSRTIADYAWDFGNGRSAHGVTTTTSYDTAGTYNVTLVVTDDVGQKASKSQAVTVSASSSTAPTASFVFSPSAPAAGEPVFFDASTSSAAAGHSITSYAWAFGDGTTGTGRTVTKAAGYATAATYTVMLTVTDDLGHTASASQAVLIGNAVTPTANFAVSPSPAWVGVQVVVDASSSTTSVGQTIVRYEWNFGDATTIYSTTSRTFTHSYALVGNYMITLTITDSAGRQAAATVLLGVGVYIPPVANFTFSPSPGTAGVPINFDASTSSGVNPLRYEWTFGDSTQVFGGSLSPTITHTYTASGTYNVTLTVTDTVTGRQSGMSRAVIVQ